MTTETAATSRSLTVSSIENTHGIPRRTTLAAIERGALRAARLPGPRGQYVIEPKAFKAWQAKRARRAARMAERRAKLAAKVGSIK